MRTLFIISYTRYNMRVGKQEKKPESKLDNFVIWARLKKLLKHLHLKTKLLPTALLFVLLALLLISYEVYFENKFYPITYIGNVNVSFLTPKDAYKILNYSALARQQSSLDFNYKDQKFSINLASSSAKINFQGAIDQAFVIGHGGSFYEQFLNQIQNLAHPAVINPEGDIFLDPQLASINNQIHIEPVDARLIIDESNPATTSAQVNVVDGSNGQDLDFEKFKSNIIGYLSTGYLDYNLPIKSVEPTTTTDEALTARQFLESNSAEPIRLTFNTNSWNIDTKVLLSFINLEKPQILDQDRMQSYLKEIVANAIDQPVQEGLFEFDPNSKKVSEFKASQEGRKLNIEKATELIISSLQNSGPKHISLPVDVVKPKITTADVNNLGVNDLIGQGISNFAHSIPNRIYNVNLGASKLNGILVPPGETFSFNQSLGDISAATGFKQAYVIKSGRTVLDDGGGICQVSTTLFRAVLNSGLPVVDRTAHAYRVGYYEQGFPPGLDATIFYPSVDFKFKNDTSSHILIQAQAIGLTLYVNLYGTKDGRVATVSKPVILSQSPALPDLRQDDPTLPVGTVKQVDFAAAGANVIFNRTVVKNGETLISESFRSNYRPWQAIYLVGTAPQ